MVSSFCQVGFSSELQQFVLILIFVTHSLIHFPTIEIKSCEAEKKNEAIETFKVFIIAIT